MKDTRLPDRDRVNGRQVSNSTDKVRAGQGSRYRPAGPGGRRGPAVRKQGSVTDRADGSGTP
jgi:hypothetical protein